jgi:hypothetical protein
VNLYGVEDFQYNDVSVDPRALLDHTNSEAF